ncbi:MAG: TIGR02530 family flagellar biosynthesis protein [Myxococcota bacterium]|nr:TIGR02530 family flagellar biosynthesis protein [Myxococcota bacterium]
MKVARVTFEGIRPPTTATPKTEVDGRFAEHLRGLLDQNTHRETQVTEEAGSLQWSRHSLARLKSRGIELSTEDLASLGDAVNRLSEKGARESLLLMDDNAFIVGIPKRTVITAMRRGEAIGNIFTSIDSTLVVR